MKKLFTIIKILSINFMYLFLFVLFRIFKVDRNKILIVNYRGKGYGDSLKPITEELLNKNPAIKIIWLVNNKQKSIPQHIKQVKIGGFRSIYHYSTSAIWLDNCRKTHFLMKKKKQTYIQLWHGSTPLKKIEKDAVDKLNERYIFFAKKDSKLADLMIYNSDISYKIMTNAFWYDGLLIKSGTPRLDIMFSNDVVFESNLSFLNDNKTKVLMYAPTFRNKLEDNYYKIDFQMLLNYLEKVTKENWIILFRKHPNVNLINFELPDKVIDVTEYPDMYELLSVSDILITDYSSTMFEFPLINKPVFIFAYDKDSYIDERGFYYDLEELPFDVSCDMDGLTTSLRNYFSNKKEYLQKQKLFFKANNFLEDGKASERIASIIIDIINKGKHEVLNEFK